MNKLEAWDCICKREPL